MKPKSQHFQMKTYNPFLVAEDLDWKVMQWSKLVKSFGSIDDSNFVVRCEQMERWPSSTIRYFSEKTITSSNTSQMQKQQMLLQLSANLKENEMPPLLLICTTSDAFLQKQEFKLKLQEELKLKLVERDIKTGEDLLIDERTCVLFVEISQQNLGNLKAYDDTLSQVAKRIARLSIRFETIWLILENFSQQKETRTKICHFIQSLSLILLKTDVQIVYRYSFSIKDSVNITKDAIQQASKFTPVWNNIEDWSNRNWMLERQTKLESFLTSFPCCNAFCAQLILAFYPNLIDFVELSLQDKISTLVHVPPNVLRMLHNSLTFVSH